MQNRKIKSTFAFWKNNQKREEMTKEQFKDFARAKIALAVQLDSLRVPAEDAAEIIFEDVINRLYGQESGDTAELVLKKGKTQKEPTNTATIQLKDFQEALANTSELTARLREVVRKLRIEILTLPKMPEERTTGSRKAITGPGEAAKRDPSFLETERMPEVRDRLLRLANGSGNPNNKAATFRDLQRELFDLSEIFRDKIGGELQDNSLKLDIVPHEIRQKPAESRHDLLDTAQRLISNMEIFLHSDTFQKEKGAPVFRRELSDLRQLLPKYLSPEIVKVDKAFLEDLLGQLRAAVQHILDMPPIDEEMANLMRFAGQLAEVSKAIDGKFEQANKAKAERLGHNAVLRWANPTHFTHIRPAKNQTE